MALQALFERFPDLAPAGPAHRRGTIILRGYESMPVALGSHRPRLTIPRCGTLPDVLPQGGLCS